MIELYHHGSSVCAAKARFCLAEKDLEWKGHYLDILKGDQFDPEYMKINPMAVVPTLVHNGNVIIESSLICEYIDDAFPDPPLKPQAALDRFKMRMWTKSLDDEIHAACGEVTFVCCHRHIINRLSPEDREAFLTATPDKSVTKTWNPRKRELCDLGFEAPGIAKAFKLYDKTLDRMQADLEQSEWLAGDTFSLADIGLTPYVNRLDMLGMSSLWEGTRPRVAEWFEAIKARPTFKPSFLDWCSEDLTNDLKNYGSQSLDGVHRVISDGAPAKAADADSPSMCAVG